METTTKVKKKKSTYAGGADATAVRTAIRRAALKNGLFEPRMLVQRS